MSRVEAARPTLAFDDLTKLEPRLKELAEEARSYHQRRKLFCANWVWYREGIGEHEGKESLRGRIAKCTLRSQGVQSSTQQQTDLVARKHASSTMSFDLSSDTFFVDS